MNKSPEARYMIGSVTTKDQRLWERVRNLQTHGETMESILKRGVEVIEQDSIDDMKNS